MFGIFSLIFVGGYFTRTRWQDHNDLCEVCSHGGNLLCCDTCSLVFHTKCLRPELKEIPEGDWSCQFCVMDNPKNTQGAEEKRVPYDTPVVAT